MQKVRKGGISQSCKACGHTGQIDMKHKLTAFVLKNPPPSDDQADSSAGMKKVEEADGAAVELKNGNENGHETDEEWAPDCPNGDDALTERMKALVVHADLDKTDAQRLDLFYEWLKVGVRVVCVTPCRNTWRRAR